MTDRTTTPRTGQAAAQTDWYSKYLYGPNPVFRYGIATVVVFGSLYVAQSFGLSFAWPVALVIGLGFLAFTRGVGKPNGGIDWGKWGKP